jgi:hypothetical protein
MEYPKHVSHFLKITSPEQRLSYLRECRAEKRWFSVDLVQDLMALELSEALQRELLYVVECGDKLSLEDFLTKGIFVWPQNVVSIALNVWAEKTDCELWHRPLALARLSETSQRVAYTLLDLAWHAGGESLILRFLEDPPLKERSAAFFALLLQRACEWNIDHPRLKEISQLVQGEPLAVTDKDTLFKLLYQARFHTREDQYLHTFENNFDFWMDLSRTMHHGKVPPHGGAKKVIHFGDETDWNKMMQHILREWPALWERDLLSQQSITSLFEVLERFYETMDARTARSVWHLFAGIDQSKLTDAVCSLPAASTMSRALGWLGHLLSQKSRFFIYDAMEQRGYLADKSSAAGLPTLMLNEYPRLPEQGADHHSNIRQESESFSKLSGMESELLFSALQVGSGSSKKSEEEIARRAFFSLAYEDKAENVTGGMNGFWPLLTKAWLEAKDNLLDALASEARKADPLFHIAYIDTLGRFKGNDKAALRLLDYIRSDDEQILLAVVRALVGIGTLRAHQELVAFITRPNATTNVQLEIITSLRECDLSVLQGELRSAVHDLEKLQSGGKLGYEIRDALVGLLHPKVVESSSTAKGSLGEDDAASVEELDRELEARIRGYHELSSEIKRALRTALFFHKLVDKTDRSSTIDLSPAIDMQYKAMELIFREAFEYPVQTLLNQGTLQRKLDVLGYARPISSKMDEYEKYIESLPLMNTIPFFSRFKLGKMLKAICAYRRGKRFTLDGLKAFALFFLCFSRKNCKYGLADQFPIPNITDDELFGFVKDLHMFQDFRNRAAHEGFHPERSNDLDGIWNYTIKIIATVARMKEAPGCGPDCQLQQPKSGETAKIVKKAS